MLKVEECISPPSTPISWSPPPIGLAGIREHEEGGVHSRPRELKQLALVCVFSLLAQSVSQCKVRLFSLFVFSLECISSHQLSVLSRKRKRERERHMGKWKGLAQGFALLRDEKSCPQLFSSTQRPNFIQRRPDIFLF